MTVKPEIPQINHINLLCFRQMLKITNFLILQAFDLEQQDFPGHVVRKWAMTLWSEPA